MAYQVLVIPADGSAPRLESSEGLSDLQRLVGGYIQYLPLEVELAY